jgi:hypothetical protein
MKGRAAVTCCPKYAAPAFPNPPELTKLPVVVEVLAVVAPTESVPAALRNKVVSVPNPMPPALVV